MAFPGGLVALRGGFWLTRVQKRKQPGLLKALTWNQPSLISATFCWLEPLTGPASPESGERDQSRQLNYTTEGFWKTER